MSAKHQPRTALQPPPQLEPERECMHMRLGGGGGAWVVCAHICVCVPDAWVLCMYMHVCRMPVLGEVSDAWGADVCM